MNGRALQTMVASVIALCIGMVAACGGSTASSGPARPTARPTIAVRPLVTPSADGHTAPPLPPSEGAVAGFAEGCMGARSGSSFPNVTVSLYSGPTVVAREVVGWGKEYWLEVPPGSYIATNNPAGVAPDNPGGVAVTVHAGQVTRRDLPDVCK